VPATAPDFAPYRTADGSYTLRSVQIDEHYHSVVGAVNESTHVFVQSGLEHVLATQPQRPVKLLEVGLGTGLNLLLSWIRCLEGKCTVDYTALEPFPVSASNLEELAYCDDLAWPGLHAPYMDRMTTRIGERWEASGGLSFQQLPLPALELHTPEPFDLIYFDAFGPNTQPEMWTLEVFQHMLALLRPGGVLVTYCAKGEVRRTMEAAGFTVERLQGPPGKREMLRGRR
jgi:tRNA U34 5-methylaminomethyl-2-thiouridine-forming methyltransferase MnmC